MKTKSLLKLLPLMIAVILAGSCRRSSSPEIIQSSYNPRISAFSSGYIPVNGHFMVEFSDSVPGIQPGQQARSSLTTITPRINGNWQWTDHRTLQFVPSAALPSGKEWQITVHLSQLFPDQKEDFLFGVSTLPQNYRVTTNHLQPASTGDYDNYKLTGKVTLANDIAPEAAKNILKAALNGENVPVTWQHTSGTTHLFEIAPLQRSEKQGQLLISHSGKHIDSKDEGTLEIAIPAIGDFSVQNVEVEQQPRQVIRIAFSAPLQEGQNLDGLFTLSGNVTTTWQLHENLVELFPAQNIYGDYELSVLTGIRSILGDQLEEVLRQQVHFSSLNPAIEFIGQGNILPFSNNLMIHFRAVSLNAVLVRIIKVYESNVPHFLQINTLDQGAQIKRAGRLIHHSVISLEEDATLDLNRWNTYALELSRFIQPEPGAIYRVELGFDRSFSVFPCDNDEPSEPSGLLDEDRDFWDEPDNYFSSYPYVYQPWDWQNRDNPCSDAYYRRSRWVSRNIFASNIGIIAKSGSAREVQIITTDIATTQPLHDVSLKILNFQLQPLATGNTGSDGKAILSLPDNGRPFLLVAGKDRQKGYLRMDDGRSLPLSRFDVAGQTVREGLKGYIYGERGVWRPGDSVFISFIPEDRLNRMPANHPVTFELFNPHGRMVHRQVARHPENRIFSFRTATSEDAPTGFWLARVSFGDAVFERSIRIETIRPNRLRIDLDFEDEMLKAGRTNNVGLLSEWLHGASAAGLRAQITLNLQPTTTAFQNYRGFVFDDELKRFEPTEEIIFDQSLNADGKSLLTLRPDLKQPAPGFLNAQFTTRVFEAGGSFSIDQISVPLSPYRRYIGIRPPRNEKENLLETDKDYNIEIVSIDENGSKLSISNLRYRIYKVGWRWWWDRTEENLARYVSSGSAKLVSEGHTSTINGQGTIPFKIEHPEWGRYLIQVTDPMAGGHSASTTVRVDWPGWMQRGAGLDADAASMLLFSADKERYETGETVTVTFPSGGKGRALVSIENGTRIIESWWVEPGSDATTFSFEVTEEMTPNIYVHISYLQPHVNRGNDLPIRLYGVIPVEVHSSASLLHPVINADEEWRPGQNAEVRVSEKNNRAMSYTLAIVDEGLLNLTRFRTPSPWDHFNAREALGVKTWDLYDFVLGAYGGRIERVFSIGGDDELLGAGTDNQVRRFEPMVRFLGPFNLRRRGDNHHQIEIPNYTGSVRVMVVATAGDASGSAEQAVRVRQPLMVWSALPRVLGPEETVMLPVTIFASGEALGNVKVSVNTGDNLTSIGAREQTIRFDRDGEQTIFFELKAGKLTGITRVEVAATSGREKGSHTVHLPVRNPNPPVTRVESAILAAGKEVVMDYALPGIKGTNQTTLELSVIPPMDFGRRLKYLVQYPHGCLEQIISGGFPQIFMSEMVEMTPEMISHTQANVQRIINQLSRYQMSNGGMAYWPGGNRSDEWSASYAGHFMLEAEKKGYAIPVAFKRNWLNYQKNISSAWVPDRSGRYPGSAFIQAYRLYTLALAGQPDLAGMNRLRQQQNLNVATTWRLAAAYATAGMDEVAREIITGLPESGSSPETYRYTYGSEERDMAMVLETLLILNEREKAARLARQLAVKMNSTQWMSTQTTAFGLVALSRYTKGQQLTSDEVNIQYAVQNKRPENIRFSKPLWQTHLKLEENPEGQITVKNESNREVFVNLIMTGEPLHDVNIEPVSENLTMTIEYTDLNNRPVDIAELRQGDDFKATVILVNSGAMVASNLALTQIFPSGWEIRNTRFEESGQTHELDQPDYRDIRDDRVNSYLDLRPGERKRLVTLLHASYAGEFVLPAVTCEAMYDYSIRAVVPGKRVVVKRMDE